MELLLKHKNKIMPIIIGIFIILAIHNHFINKDTSEISTISNVFSTTYRYSATVYFCDNIITYEFTGKTIDAGTKAYYEFDIIEDGKPVIIKAPINRTIIKQYKEKK